MRDVTLGNNTVSGIYAMANDLGNKVTLGRNVLNRM